MSLHYSTDSPKRWGNSLSIDEIQSVDVGGDNLEIKDETMPFCYQINILWHCIRYCLVARKEATMQDLQVEGFTEKEYGMVRLENVGDVLFQALLLDDLKFDEGKMYAEFCTCLFDKLG